MAYLLYSYLIRKTVPLLDEDEWQEVEGLIKSRSGFIMAYKKETGCSLEDARKYEPRGQEALERYFQICGQRLDHPAELYGVRLSRLGAVCPSCDKPLRTPKAKMCVECGYELPEGEVAGPLQPKSIAHLRVKTGNEKS